jgi:hypothetical protein
MLISSETWCLHNDPIITLTMVKSLKCNEPISFLTSHSDLSQWTVPHLSNNDEEMLKMFMDDQMFFVEAIN